MKNLFLLLLMFYIASPGFSQPDNNFTDKVISLEKKEHSARELLETLNKVEGISIVYNSSDEFLDNRIYLKNKKLSLIEILNQLGEQIPYTYSFKANYIILKKKELENAFRLYGNVLEKGSNHPVIAANIYIPEVKKGKISEADGSYFFELKPGNYTLICTFVGYKAIEEKIALFKDMKFNIYLEQLPHEIGEVEIISRRTEPEDRINVARNIETLDEKDLNQLNTNIATDVFQGRITGLWSTKMSGAPGEHQKIHIRGINSLFASTDPLFIIDGLPVPNVNLNTLGIADLNVRDIENIKVFKDASSTAYYGYQGANGVILIETKKGGESQIRFSTKHGIQQFNERYDLMETKDFLNTFRMTDSLYFSDDHKFYKEYTGYYSYIDSMKQNVVAHVDTQRYVYPLWHDSLDLYSYDYQDALFTRGIVNEYHLDGSGSIKGINFYLSGNLFNHQGIITNTSYKKYSLTSNLGKRFYNGMEIGLSYRGSKQENRNNLDNYMGNIGILKAINTEPEYESLSPFYRKLFRNYLPAGEPFNSKNMDMVRIKEMYPYYHESVPTLYIGDLEDPVNFFGRDNQLHSLIIHNLSGRFSYEFMPGLVFNANASISVRDNLYNSNLVGFSRNGFSADSVYLNSDEKYIIMNQSFSLGYTRVLGNHSFHLAGTYRNYVDYVNWNIDSTRNVELDAIDKTSSGYIKGSNAIYGKDGDIMRSIRSLIGHFRYAFKEKYTLSAFMNIDHLEEGNNINVTDVFSSLAFNWNVWNELGSYRPGWLSGLNLYVNWGQSGNYPLNGLSNDIFTKVLVDIKLDKTDGVYISNLANHYLQNEELTEKNLGTSISILNKRILLEADFFRKKNRNLIIERDIPFYYGGGKFMYNIGQLENTGYELSLELTPFNSRLFSWVSRFGYSYNNQEVTEISDMHDTLYYNNGNIFIPDFEVAVNSPLGVIKGYRYEGLWTDEDDSLDHNFYLGNNGMKYLNADSSDNILSREDKVVIGNSIPDFTLFWNNSLKIKNLRIDFLWYAVAGVDKFNATRASTFYTGRHSGVGKFIADTLNPHMDNVFYESSYFIEDASFIRLKNVNFTYTPQKPIFKKVKTSFSLSFENLLTISRYGGYDPESSIYTDNNFSDHAVDFGAYPSPRGVYFGIDLIF